MAIQYNENIKIAAPAPLDKRYLSNRTLLGVQLPYSGITEVNTIIISSERYTGLTVNILGVEYWYRGGVGNSDLIEKKYNSEIPSGDFVTGGTNIGFFSGYTGIQKLPINHLTDNNYDGDYNSIYNYYYRGVDGKIHTGTPSDGIPKRGYVKTTALDKSWVWNEYTGSGNLLGWILIDGDISQQIGTFQNGVTYYGASTPYTTTSWTTGSAYNNASNIVINTVTGSLTTGSTYTNGGIVYINKNDNILEFRSIQSKTPENIKISYDESIIYLSGITSTIQGSNIGTGVGVYSSLSGTTLQFRKLLGSGNTTVTQKGNDVVIYSSGGTDSGFYDLLSPAAVTVGGLCVGTVLTGKTSFELFEEILVPTLNPTLTAPSSSIGLSPSASPLEVGCTIGILCVTSTFNAGCINPQYTAACNKRSNGVSSYCFTGDQVAGCYVCATSPLIECATSYAIVSGTQTWSTCANHLCGVQPKNNKGNNYCTPLNAGATTCVAASLCGIYPYYYGKLTGSTRPTVTNSLVTGGTKVVASSVGTVTISFNSASNQYTWLAIPQLSTTKKCWYVTALDNGFMNRSCATDKYPDECLLCISSGQGCWVNQCYRIYMSGSVGAISAAMEFRNS